MKIFNEQERDSKGRWMAGFVKGLESSSITLEAKAHITDQVGIVVGSMSNEMHQAMEKSVKYSNLSIVGHENIASVQKTYASISGSKSAAKGVVAMYINQDKSLHVARCPEIAENYTHELMHVLDCNLSYANQAGGRRLSDNKNWAAAWTEETLNSKKPVSRYAQTDAEEGFCEFGRLIMLNSDYAEKHYPKQTAYFASKGLHKAPVKGIVAELTNDADAETSRLPLEEVFFRGTHEEDDLFTDSPLLGEVSEDYMRTIEIGNSSK